jgi:MFS family permease
MIPCSKLTDRWGRKRCFIGGLTLYGIGALVSAVSPNLGVLILGNSVCEGVGTALLIPPVYILATVWFDDLTARAWAFGAISGLGGVGAAAGPLIGGVITTTTSWRAAFLFQAAVVATIILLSRKMVDPIPADPTRPFDAVGAGLSAVGMFFLVLGILQAGTRNTLFVLFLAIGLAFLVGFYLYIRRLERIGGAAAIDPLFRNRTCNLRWSPRTSSGCCSGRVLRGVGVLQECAGTARSAPGWCSRPPSACSSRHSRPNVWPGAGRSGRC